MRTQLFGCKKKETLHLVKMSMKTGMNVYTYVENSRRNLSQLNEKEPEE